MLSLLCQYKRDEGIDSSLFIIIHRSLSTNHKKTQQKASAVFLTECNYYKNKKTQVLT